MPDTFLQGEFIEFDFIQNFNYWWVYELECQQVLKISLYHVENILS